VNVGCNGNSRRLPEQPAQDLTEHTDKLEYSVKALGQAGGSGKAIMGLSLWRAAVLGMSMTSATPAMAEDFLQQALDAALRAETAAGVADQAARDARRAAIDVLRQAKVASSATPFHDPVYNCAQNKLSAKIVYLTGFYAEANGDPLATGHYTAPINMSQGANVTPYQPFFDAIDQIIPQGFHNFLCHKIDYIFIDANATHAYAFWETDSQKNAANHQHNWVFIGVPISYFPVPDLATSEAAIFWSLTGVTVTYSISDQEGHNPDGRAALSGILAHEAGHISWYKQITNPQGNQASCQNLNKPYHDIAWQLSNYRIPSGFHGPRYDAQGLANENHLDSSDPYPAEVHDISSAQTNMQILYGNQNFVSLFAASSPDDDFAENYKFSVLAQLHDPNGASGNVDLGIKTVTIGIGGQSYTNQFSAGNNGIKGSCANDNTNSIPNSN
jgi:hypothetical protein